MGIHILFIIIYVLASQYFPGEAINGLLAMHCLINIFSNTKNLIARLNLSVFINLGVGIASFANILFIQKVKQFGVSDDVLHIYNYIDIRYVDEASLLWAIGNSFIFIGFEFFSKKSFPSISHLVDDKKVLKNMFNVMAFISILPLTGNFINLGFISGGLQKIVQLLLSVGILFYSRLWVVENNKRYGVYALALCIYQTFLALTYSYIRIDLITPSGILFLGYFLGKGDIKYLFSARIVPVIIVFAIFFQFFSTFGSHRAHFIEAFIKPDAANVRYTYVQSDEGKGGTLMERSSNIAQLTNIVKLIKENGFYNGRASAPLVAAVVPRVLWPNKPKIELGSWFALQIGAATISEVTGRANNSVNMTVPGELYLDFNWFGLIFGCLLWGWLLASFWNAAHFNDSPYNLLGTLWGGYMIQGAMGAFVDMQSIITISSTYLVFLITKKILDHYAHSRLRPSLERQ